MAGNEASVTTTFVASTKAKSAEVNQNFTDLVNALTDGTKDITVGTGYWKTAATNTTHSFTSSDSIRSLFINNTAAATITLPLAASNTGRIIDIKKISDTAGAIAINGSGSETIDNTTTVTLLHLNQGMSFQCDGSEWKKVGENEKFDYLEVAVGGATAMTGTTWMFTRKGNNITVSADLEISHASSANIDSVAGVLPTRFRPPGNKYNVYQADGTRVRIIIVQANGTITLQYKDWAGSASADTGSDTGPTISYQLLSP